MSLRHVVITGFLLSAWLGVTGAVAAQFDVTPADRILVVDEGKTGTIKVKATDGSKPSWTAVSDSGDITVSPESANPSSARTFKVSAKDAFSGAQTEISIQPTGKGADGTPPILVTVYVVMKQKEADKLLKKGANSAIKELRGTLKDIEKGAPGSFQDLLDQAEIDLAAVGETADGMSADALRRAVISYYLHEGQLLYLTLIINAFTGYYSSATNLSAQGYFWLVQYSLPIVATLAYMTGGGGAWDQFIIKAIGLLSGSTGKLRTALAKYMSGLAALALVYGIPLSYGYLAPDPDPPCILGPTNQVAFDAGDGIIIDLLRLQLLLMLASNEAGMDRGLIGVEGLADPDKGDVTVSIEELRGPFTEQIVATVFLDGRWSATLGEVPDSDGGPLAALGQLPPGQYRVMISQGDEGEAMIVKYIDVPRRALR